MGLFGKRKRISDFDLLVGVNAEYAQLSHPGYGKPAPAKYDGPDPRLDTYSDIGVQWAGDRVYGGAKPDPRRDVVTFDNTVGIIDARITSVGGVRPIDPTLDKDFLIKLREDNQRQLFENCVRAAGANGVRTSRGQVLTFRESRQSLTIAHIVAAFGLLAIARIDKFLTWSGQDVVASTEATAVTGSALAERVGEFRVDVDTLIRTQFDLVARGADSETVELRTQEATAALASEAESLRDLVLRLEASTSDVQEYRNTRVVYEASGDLGELELVADRASERKLTAEAMDDIVKAIGHHPPSTFN